ncbi:MAG: hypothetical protein J1F12_06830 [Muribaculaceae bacterium]|nr:hypothetical protein [Muribaculaceae bacterium]
MELRKVLRTKLVEVLVDNFDITDVNKTDDRFDIWMEEKNEQIYMRINTTGL